MTVPLLASVSDCSAARQTAREGREGGEGKRVHREETLHKAGALRHLEPNYWQGQKPSTAKFSEVFARFWRQVLFSCFSAAVGFAVTVAWFYI